MKNDAVSRSAAINKMVDLSCNGKTVSVVPVSEIEQLPPIQPKRGKWIRVGSGSLYDYYKCSECGKQPKWDCMGDNRWKIAFTDFCPNCGCRMDGGEQ